MAGTMAGIACGVCGKVDGVMMCACGLVGYCEKACQKEARKGHKKACRQALREKEAAAGAGRRRAWTTDDLDLVADGDVRAVRRLIEDEGMDVNGTV